MHESVGELRKVDWPTQKQLLAATLAVIIACVVVGAFLFVADEAFRRLVKDVILAG
ncbi:MAG: preprotein translocase subunit SecE [Thermoleophilia bacterium]